ncbi:hypothetical protein [Aeromicrobium wangtongii]|uniref:DUF4386 family protein n=1 Tax=Aeromicrobium wangtongii TaxID=2969247 RepID=A0ABY5MAK9_9ACTN|nr:hypothetical protein [Aeromicrobium wangtongii]MCD9197348.1 hypothetical protein [Aeromicrobium wangtongii]UUP14842.1 hypothetical protein NQV15_05890 [Aeromicrobium wangtongii]
MLDSGAEIRGESFERAVDLDRFERRTRGTLLGVMAAGVLVMFFVGWPLVWHGLDTAELLGDVAGSTPMARDGDRVFTLLYTAAYGISNLAFLVAVVIYLLWRRRHDAADRWPTPLLLVLGALAVLQLTSIAVAWGDQFTGRAIHESLEDVGVSSWGRDVIERGWYAGYVTQVGTAALGAAVLGLGARRGWWVFLIGFVALVPAVWFAVGRPYIG